MGDVILVTEHQLQCVLPGLKIELNFSLSTTKMFVVFISRNAEGKFLGPVFALAKRWPVNKEMMMAGFVLADTGRRNTHALQAKQDLERALHLGAILQIDKINRGARG